MKYLTGAVRILGSWYAAFPGDTQMYLQHPYTKWLLLHMLLPSGFLHSFSCGNDNNKLYLWPYPGGVLQNRIGSRQSFNPSLWTLPLQLECWLALAFLRYMGALKVEYLIIIITSFLLHANNVYMTMYFVGSLIFLLGKRLYLGKTLKTVCYSFRIVMPNNFTNLIVLSIH